MLGGFIYSGLLGQEASGTVMAIHNTSQVVTIPQICVSLRRITWIPLPFLSCPAQCGKASHVGHRGRNQFTTQDDGQTQMKPAAVTGALESPGEDTEQPQAEC